MGGRSGKAVAGHTRIVSRGGVDFTISETQQRLIERAQGEGGSTKLSVREMRSADVLRAIQVATLSGDVLQLCEGVRIR